MSFFMQMAEEIQKPLEIGRPTSDVDLVTISIQCPHCREFGSFEVMARTVLVFHRSGEKTATGIEYIASVRVCPNATCKGLIFAITDGVGVLFTSYAMKLTDVQGSGGAKRHVAFRPSANPSRSVEFPDGLMPWESALPTDRRLRRRF
jgi:hypothetical protein